MLGIGRNNGNQAWNPLKTYDSIVNFARLTPLRAMGRRQLASTVSVRSNASTCALKQGNTLNLMAAMVLMANMRSLPWSCAPRLVGRQVMRLRTPTSTHRGMPPLIAPPEVHQMNQGMAVS